MKNKNIKIILILAICVILIDQVSKFAIEKAIISETNNGFITISKSINDGLAIGFNEGNNKNIILMMFVLFIVIKFIVSQREQIDIKTSIALGMVLGGGIGNFIDRIFRGGVFDFIKFGNFFTGNVADIFVIIGWMMIIIFVVTRDSIKNKKDGEKTCEKE